MKFERIKDIPNLFPKSLLFFIRSYPLWVFKKQYWKKELIKNFNKYFKHEITKDKISNCIHHKSHVASAFFPSKFKNAVILVLDGVGELILFQFGKEKTIS